MNEKLNTVFDIINATQIPSVQIATCHTLLVRR